MASIAQFARNLIRNLTDTYYPEQHYMRGPGPKWAPSTWWAEQSAPIGRRTVPSFHDQPEQPPRAHQYYRRRATSGPSRSSDPVALSCIHPAIV